MKADCVVWTPALRVAPLFAQWVCVEVSMCCACSPCPCYILIYPARLLPIIDKGQDHLSTSPNVRLHKHIQEQCKPLA